MSRTTSVLLVVLAIAGLGYLYIGRGQQSSSATSPATTSPARPTTRQGLLTPLQALAASRQRFRLVLDRRFVEALSIIARFPSSGDTAVPALRFEDGAWTVSLDGKIVGHLPAYPDFDDMLAVLRDAMAKVNPSFRPLPEASGETERDDAPFDDHALIQGLQALDTAYRPGGIRTSDLRQAAAQLARLAYFEDNHTEAGDEIYAKALALLALAEASTGSTMTKSEGLLASAMGYSAAATRRALSLPEDDPWRLYVTRSDEALRHAAVLDPDSRELSYFWLKRLADLDRPDDWVGWTKARYSVSPAPLYAVQTVATLQGHAPVFVNAYGVPAAVLEDLGEDGSALDVRRSISVDPKDTLDRLDDALGRLKVPAGPYLDVAELEGYYRGDVCAAVEAYGKYLIDLWGRASDARRYLALLGKAQGDVGHELATWYSDKIASEEGGRDLAGVVDDMTATRLIGPGLYTEMLTALENRLEEGGPEIRGAAERIAPLFDTRPSLRAAYANVLGAALDVPDREDIYQSLALQASDDDSYVQIFLYAREGDAASLLKVAEDRHRPAWLRANALGYLAKQSYAAGAIGKAYEDILADYPTEGSGYEAYLAFLEDQHDYTDAARVAKTWLLSQPDDKNVFDFWKATDSLAHAELGEGDPHQAWLTLVPALFEDRQAPAPGTKASDLDTTGHGPSLDLGFAIAMANHDSAMAEALAQVEAGLYPDDLASQTTELRYWWATGKDDQVAALLVHWPHPVSDWQWDHVIGTAFAKTVGTDVDRAAAALAALIKAHVDPSSLRWLVDAVSQAGQHRTAFALLEQLYQGGGGMLATLASYDELKKYEPQATAEQWMDRRLPQARRDEASMYLYAAHQDELLWDIVDPAKVAYPDQVWLLRAATIAEGAPVTATERQALAGYLKQAGPLWYVELARYVTGGSDGAEILGKPLDPHSLSEASYYLALHAFAEGHYREGAEWLNVDLDTGETRNGEWHFGQTVLVNCLGSGASLKRLGTEGKLFSFSD